MPYASRKQEAYFNEHRAELEAKGVNVDEWNNASKGMKLPERARTANTSKWRKAYEKRKAKANG